MWNQAAGPRHPSRLRTVALRPSTVPGDMCTDPESKKAPTNPPPPHSGVLLILQRDLLYFRASQFFLVKSRPKAEKKTPNIDEYYQISKWFRSFFTLSKKHALKISMSPQRSPPWVRGSCTSSSSNHKRRFCGTGTHWFAKGCGYSDTFKHNFWF